MQFQRSPARNQHPQSAYSVSSSHHQVSPLVQFKHSAYVLPPAPTSAPAPQAFVPAPQAFVPATQARFPPPQPLPAPQYLVPDPQDTPTGIHARIVSAIHRVTQPATRHAATQPATRRAAALGVKRGTKPPLWGKYIRIQNPKWDVGSINIGSTVKGIGAYTVEGGIKIFNLVVLGTYGVVRGIHGAVDLLHSGVTNFVAAQSGTLAYNEAADPDAL